MMRHLIIRLTDESGYKIDGDPVGLVKISGGQYVDHVHPFHGGVIVIDISEAEYTSYQALELFPEYEYTTLLTKPAEYCGMLVAYNPNRYKVEDKKLISFLNVPCGHLT